MGLGPRFEHLGDGMKQSLNGRGRKPFHADDWVPPNVRDMVVPRRPEPLAVRSLRIGELLLIEALGELDGRTVARLTGALHEPRGVTGMVLDLSELVLLDPIAAKSLKAEHRRLQAEGKGMALLCPPGEVRRVLELAGVTDVVPAFADPDAALDAASGRR